MKVGTSLLILQKKKRIIREYCEKIICQKMDNLDEVDKFPETQNLPRLNHKEIYHLNRLMTSKESESSIKNLPTKESLDLIALLANHTFKVLIPIILKLLQKIKEEGTLPTLFYETNIRLTPKTKKTTY